MIRNFTIFTPSLPPGESQGEGSLGKVHQLFGDKLNMIIEELLACALSAGRNETLAA